MHQLTILYKDQVLLQENLTAGEVDQVYNEFADCRDHGTTFHISAPGGKLLTIGEESLAGVILKVDPIS